jgi:quinol monooxygenase YgiN
MKRIREQSFYIESRNCEKQHDAIYVLTHLDVVPPNQDDCITLLKSMSAETPKEPGNIGYSVLQQANRTNHFTVFEIWASRRALDVHAAAAHTHNFREKVLPIAGALYDERFYKMLR